MNKRIRKKRMVFIVAFSDYDEHGNIAAFSDRKRAQKEADRLNVKRGLDSFGKYPYGHDVEEFIIQ